MIGLIYYYVDDYPVALSYYHRALKKSQEISGKGEAGIFNNLGLVYRKTGNYSQAISCFNQALAVDRDNNDNKGEMGDIINIGLVHYCLGNYHKALSYYQQSLKIAEDIDDEKAKATNFTNIGLCYYCLNDYSQALSYLKKALKLERNNANKPEVASDLINIAIVYNTMGDPIQALSYYRQSLKIAEEIGAREIEAANYVNIGFAYQNLEKHIEAAESFNKGELIALQIDIPETMWRAYYGKALILEKQGKEQEALSKYMVAIETIESMRSKLKEEGHKTDFTNNKIFVYDHLIDILIKMHNKDSTEKFDYKAFHYAERAKARTFLDMMATRSFQGKNINEREILTRDRDLQREILVLKKKNSSLRKNAEEIKNVEKELKKKQTEYETFIKEVKLKKSELASLISVNPASVEQIQSWIDEDITLLEYYTTEDRTYAWLLTRNVLKTYVIDVMKKDLVAKVNDFLLPNISNQARRPIPVINLPTSYDYQKQSQYKERKRNREIFYQIAYDFYELIIAPLVKDIKTQKLIIVPHGALHKVPFAALKSGKSFMIDKYVISILPSSGVIEYILKKKNHDKKKLLAFANPETDYVPLGFAEFEVNEIADFFPVKDIYIGNKATEKIAKEKTSVANVIHFACHGEFNDRQIMQSGLLLAKDSYNDGYLQLHEIFELDLKNANLVTLSACETALCKIQGGDDLVGLSRGFIYAGTPSVLATLWEVDDRSTSILMKKFYENWYRKGMSKPEALRKAQISVKSMAGYEHPFYWAPFVMIGDWL
ncbi:MAG: CHAT domain-containing protein [Desulfobacterales bacterium]|nr:CHAT domain-containing protein [Desulfobacterales bacterium]